MGLNSTDLCVGCGGGGSGSDAATLLLLHIVPENNTLSIAEIYACLIPKLLSNENFNLQWSIVSILHTPTQSSLSIVWKFILLSANDAADDSFEMFRLHNK